MSISLFKLNQDFISTVLRSVLLIIWDFFLSTVYSNAIQENMNSLLYPGLIEELVDIVELKDNTFVVSYEGFKSTTLRYLVFILFNYYLTKHLSQEICINMV